MCRDPSAEGPVGLEAFNAGFEHRTGYEWLSRDDADPFAGGGALIELLGERYREAGLKDVTVTLYPGARHEIFNETNRDAITADVIDWLTAHS